MKTNKLMIIASAILLSACNQQPKGLTEADVARMLDSVKTAAKEEAKSELKSEYETQKTIDNNNSSYQQTPSTSVSYSSSSSSQESSESLTEKAYRLGAKDGKTYHTVDLNHFLKDDEKQLKNQYMHRCYGSGKSENYLSEELWNNRELYNEYKRGFLKGYENANNAL